MNILKTRVTAILGPTNTGKTYEAIKRLLAHSNGVVGFPLRLLARENYELTKAIVGEKKVALITGEEKIVPDDAKYFFCTVESIPREMGFDFVGIDEVQLACDYERGYIFTDRILENKGVKETIFMGSEAAEKILKRIYPDILVIKKNRLSQISYCGYKNLSRLPKRSAIIAFSQMDVYELATRVKQMHGGVSIVMGALSPEVRNAQVKLFEEGKVDYIVATDAIGLGLNLDIKYVFFSSIKKFDGFNERRLTNDEVAQIAGRAGRYVNDGYFGTTGGLKKLSDEIVKFVENYSYSELRNFYWRNSSLNFESSKRLLQYLSEKPEKFFFKLKRNASDERYLKLLLKDNEIKEQLRKQNNLKLLWEVCGVPDYSKNLDEHHTIFLKKVFLYLSKDKKISEDWIKISLEEIEKKTNKISKLNYKLSQIRVWSFIAFKDKWINNSQFYKKKVKQIETKLSISLHKELITHFVEESKNQLNIKNTGEDISLVKLMKKTLILGREEIGKIDSLRFRIKTNFNKTSKTFKNKILKNSLSQIVKQVMLDFESTNFKKFKFTIDGSIHWDEYVIAKIIKGRDLVNPRIKIVSDECFSEHHDKIYKKIYSIINQNLNYDLSYQPFNTEKSNNPNLRALNYYVYEKFGHCLKKDIQTYYNNLGKKEIMLLKNRKINIGIFFIFFKEKRISHLKQVLLNVFFRGKLDSFMTEDVYKFSKEIFNNDPSLYEKLGFYHVSIKKNKYLVYYQYLENVLKKIYFYKKKKSLKFLPKNSFEELAYNFNKLIVINRM